MKRIKETLDEFLELGGRTKNIILLIISAISLVFSISGILPIPFDWAWVAIILCGVPIILEALIGLITEFDIRSGVLVSIALIASVIIQEYFAAAEVAFIMQLGELLEDITVSKARFGIEKLIKLSPQTATLIVDEKQITIETKDIKVGDIILVRPGETVPVDGIIVKGESSIDQAAITGESLPVDKCTGDEVISGGINRFGVFEMRATKVGADSSLSRMIKLIESADAGKAKIVSLADRWATFIAIIAIVSAALTWILSGQILRAVTVLVVFCPCALVLATPTAIMAAIGNATRHGFLIKEGDALERLSSVSKAAFDKTGTLTHGFPSVHAFSSALPEMSDEEFYRLVASAEQFSEHPLGKAIVEKCKDEDLPFFSCESFKMLPGKGISAYVEEKSVIAGTLSLLCENNIPLPDDLSVRTDKYLSSGHTVIYSAIDGVFAGFISLADTVKESAQSTVADLRSGGVEPILLTGDGDSAAYEVAKKLNIGSVHAKCLPEDKLKHIESYIENGESICMIGDGINDAASLKRSTVGIAMGALGSDVAIESADIVMVKDEIENLPHLFSLSKKMMKIIKLNIIFSMSVNFLGISLAFFGILDPIAGALVHNAGSVIVIINSALLIKWKKTRS